ncbi:hypothetical protein [Arenimonas soli]|nr:hypothetical protein [Arenimonas soli]
MTNNTDQKTNHNAPGNKDRDGQAQADQKKQGTDPKHNDQQGGKKQAGESDRKDPAQVNEKR